MKKGTIGLWGRTHADMEAQKAALLEDWGREIAEFTQIGADALPDVTMPHDVFREVVSKALGDPADPSFALWADDPDRGFFARLSDPGWVRSVLSGGTVGDALSTRAELAVAASLEDLEFDLGAYRTDGYVPICDTDGGWEPLPDGEGTGGVPWPGDLGEVVAAAVSAAADGEPVPSGYPVSVGADPATDELVVDMGGREMRYALVGEAAVEEALSLSGTWSRREALRAARSEELGAGRVYPLAAAVVTEKELLPLAPDAGRGIEREETR